MNSLERRARCSDTFVQWTISGYMSDDVGEQQTFGCSMVVAADLV
jgi:hypothetical protein